MILSVTIPPEFAYVGPALEWFWPVMVGAASFGLGWICGGCAQRG